VFTVGYELGFHIAVDEILHSYRLENLKYYRIFLFYITSTLVWGPTTVSEVLSQGVKR
jgi:hypothetical protein